MVAEEEWRLYLCLQEASNSSYASLRDIQSLDHALEWRETLLIWVILFDKKSLAACL